MKYIKGYEGYYKIDEQGNIYSMPRNGTIKNIKKIATSKNRTGYEQCVLFKNNVGKTFLVHRLVALTYIDNPKGLPQVNHKNGLKADNRADNLEWISIQDNTKHAFEHNLNGFKDQVMRNLEYMNRNKYHKVILIKENERHEFNSTVEASAFLGTDKDNITRDFRKGHKCKGYKVICKN